MSSNGRGDPATPKDKAPDGIDPQAWRATRSIRKAMSELMDIYATHYEEKHQWQKWCQCAEMENWLRSYAYHKQYLHRALFPDKYIPNKEQRTSDLLKLMEVNLIDDDTFKRLLAGSEPQLAHNNQSTKREEV